MVERFPAMSATDHIERTTAYAGDLYVEVGFADRTLMCIVQIRHLATTGRWRAEARFDRWGECDAEQLTVDLSKSDRALTECTASTVAVRTRSGHWPVRDVLEIARGLR